MCQQLSLRLSGWETIPDVALFSSGTLDLQGDDVEMVEQAPSLVIEILSPKQHLHGLVMKLKKYLQHGVASCWLVEPDTKSVFIFPANAQIRAFTEGEVCDDSSGIRVPLAEIFP